MHRIDTIEVKNFKSIRNATICDCKRINIFIGYPNVGKSNILEAISLLTFIRQNRPVGLKGLVRFEKLTQLFNFSNIQDPAIVNFNESYSLIIKYEDEKGLGFNLFDNKESSFYHNSAVLGLRIGSETLHSGSTDKIDVFSGRFKELHEFNVKPYKFSETKIFNQSFSALELSIPFGQNMFEVILNSKEIRKEFSEILEPYGLQLIMNISENDLKISPQIKDGIINTIPISLMADTLVRLIFFKTAVLSSKDSVLLFEEPEAHMFPPYISKFTGDVTYDENGNQFFIATHSPFVINDFMENLKKDDYSIYTVGYDNETGETLIRRMTDEELHEIYQYGVDLFLNLENYLPHAQQQ